MFHVVAVNLTPDLAHASADIGQGDFGELDAAQLHAVLEAFRHVDSIQNHEADPCLRIEVRGEKFIVRTARERLFLYDGRDHAQAAAELDADGIVRVLAARDEAPAGNRPSADAPAPDLPAARKSPRRTWLGAAILLLAAAVDVHTTYRAVRPHPIVASTADIDWPAESPEVAALRRAAAGRYVTGTAPGDRVIVVEPDGVVRFGRVLASGERIDRTDTYRIGRRERQTLLGTTHAGIISVESIDTLRYFGDAYEREH